MARTPPPSVPAPEADEAAADKDVILATVGTVEGEQYDILVTIRQLAGTAPSIRLNRVGEKKGAPFIGKLGPLRSAQEARDLAAMLPKAADALDAAIKKAPKAKK
jgi:hypothetical protein